MSLTPEQQEAWRKQIRELRAVALTGMAICAICGVGIGISAARIWYGI